MMNRRHPHRTVGPPAPLQADFELADRDLGVEDVFRWPCGDGARTWLITEILDPGVDELTQRVRAIPAERALKPVAHAEGDS